MTSRMTWQQRLWGRPPQDGLATWLIADLTIHAIATAALITVLGLLMARPEDVPLGLSIFVPAILIGRTIGVAGQLAWRRLRSTG